jgi:hypothetical protein
LAGTAFCSAAPLAGADAAEAALSGARGPDRAAARAAAELRESFTAGGTGVPSCIESLVAGVPESTPAGIPVGTFGCSRGGGFVAEVCAWVAKGARTKSEAPIARHRRACLFLMESSWRALQSL